MTFQLRSPVLSNRNTGEDSHKVDGDAPADYKESGKPETNLIELDDFEDANID